eukprot:3009032-Prymnesium_polylepis.1
MILCGSGSLQFIQTAFEDYHVPLVKVKDAAIFRASVTTITHSCSHHARTGYSPSDLLEVTDASPAFMSLQMFTEGCNDTMKSALAANIRSALPNCSSSPCGPQAMCAIEAVFSSEASSTANPLALDEWNELVSANCTCVLPYLDAPNTRLPAYQTAGCLRMRHVDSILKSSEDVQVALHKDACGRGSTSQNVTLRIVGTFPSATPWAVEPPSVHWYRVLGNMSAQIFSTSDEAQSATVGISLNATGLPEESAPYASTLVFDIQTMEPARVEMPVL